MKLVKLVKLAAESLPIADLMGCRGTDRITGTEARATDGRIAVAWRGIVA